LLTVPVTAKCPDDLTQLKDGSCVVILGGADGLCNALEECALLSQTKQQDYFLIGFHQRHVTYEGPKFTWSYMWTSIADILQNRNQDRNGWRDANPRNPEHFSQEGEIVWDENQPMGSEHATAVIYSTHLLHDVPLKNFNAQVVCELIGPTTSAPTSLVQLKENFPVVLTTFYNDDPGADGCYVQSAEVNLGKCAFRCAMNKDCRSLYYHQSNGTCVQMLYIDARLPFEYRNYVRQWKRYAKTGYT
ncbi:hypothetical protein X801_08703, partial [Opisthorchis viverrini]